MVGFSVDFDKVVSAPFLFLSHVTPIFYGFFLVFMFFLHHFRSKLNYLNYRIFWEWFSYPEMNYLLLTIFAECIWTSFSGKHNQISVIGNQYREDVLPPTAIKPQRVKRVLDVQKKVTITLIFPIDIWHFKQVFFGLFAWLAVMKSSNCTLEKESETFFIRRFYKFHNLIHKSCS